MTVDTMILIITLSIIAPIFAASLFLVAYCYWKHKRTRVETIVVEQINESSLNAGSSELQNEEMSQKPKRRHIWRV